MDHTWHDIVGHVCENICVIDDLANRKFNCSLLVNQNFALSEQDYLDKVPPKCKTLVGSNYALLRPEFQKFRSESLRNRKTGDFKRVLITMGGRCR